MLYYAFFTDKLITHITYKYIFFFQRDENNIFITVFHVYYAYIDLLLTIDHIKIPLILIIVGGKQDSFEISMSYLKKNVPVLVIDGSGGSADFICKGYRMSMHTKG